MPERRVCPYCLGIYRSATTPQCPRDGHLLEPLDQDPLLGTLLAERYRIVSLIGEGAMGRVYLAEHQRIRRRFAVKTLFGDLGMKEGMRARFAREAEAASRLEHPNLVSVVDFGETERGLLYLVMEFIEGRSLEQIISTEGPLVEQRIVHLSADMARGLAHAHERDLVHRDLKTENVLVMQDARGEHPKIVDFGVARIQGPEEMQVTSAGAVIGTPAFMSPEQARGIPADPRSDLYSLGVVMYHMVTGRGPFWGTPTEVVQQLLHKPVPSVFQFNPKAKISPALEALIMRLLQKHPKDRYQDTTAVMRALDELRLDGSPTRRMMMNRSETETIVKDPTIEPEAPTEAGFALGPHLDAESTDLIHESDARDLAAGNKATELAGDSTDLVIPAPGPDRQTRHWALAVVLLMLVAVGLLGVLFFRQSHPDVIRIAAPESDASGMKTATDVLPEAQDAGGVALPTETSTAGKVDIPDAGTPETVVDAGARPPPPVVRRRPVKRPRRPVNFQSLYERVGALLSKLTDERGEARMKPYNDRYLAIPMSKALTNKTMEAESRQQLMKLERELKRLRRR